MGKTFRRNDRWKKDRRDQNFKKSKKFKEFNSGGYEGFKTPKPNESTIDLEPIEIDDTFNF